MATPLTDMVLSPADIEALAKLSIDGPSPNIMDQDQIVRLESHIRSEFEAEQKKVDALEMQLNEIREGQQRRIDQLKLLRRAAISWVHLPTELLSEVFYCLKGRIHFPVHKHNIVWALSHVCSRWRAVALGEQRLWSDVKLTFSREHQDDQSLEAMAEILRRSGDSALTLLLDCKHIRWDNAQESIPFLTVIASHTARRATSLTLIDTDDNVMKELYHILERLDLPVFPSAHELKVAPIFDDRSPNSFNDPTPVSVLARRMTNVTSLLLADDKTCIGASFNQHIFYPWSQFRSIILLKYSLSIGEALQVLSETRGLHTFKSQIVTYDLMGHTNWAPEPRSVRLPMLENLDIVLDQEPGVVLRSDGIILSTFLSPLLVPRLSKLKISSIKSGGKYSLIRMTDGANITSHICTLKSLTSVELIGCADVDVDLLLRELPRLQHLAVWHLVKSSGLLRQSVSALASQEYGVNLQSLRCRLSSADIMPFIAMLEQQWGPSQVASSNTCLVRAEVFVGWDGQSVARLNEMVRELKQRMGVNYPVGFSSLLDVSADPSDHDESDYNSYF